jgi:hypothetical protein
MGELHIDESRPNVPLLQLRLTPRFETHADGSNPTSIAVSMAIRTLPGRFRPTTPVLTLPLNRGPTETARYDGDAITAWTKSGVALSLRYEDVPDGADVVRYWYFERTVQETDIVFRFVAWPRKTDKFTRGGPRVDLRTDVNGGLIGMGESFIPVVPKFGASDHGDKSEEWQVELEWELLDSPARTRCAWSFGDGIYQQRRGTLDTTITHGIFAVGQLRRYPAWDAQLSVRSDEREFAMYWFGEPFLDMASLPPTTRRLFNSIASFFSSDKPFRVFLREVHAAWGGTGATDSYLAEVSAPTADEITDDAMTEMLAHETIHEYALLETTKPLPEGQQEPEENWYTEGIAEYYGAIALFRGGATTRKQLLKTINGFAQAYYTSPALDMDYREVLRRPWDNVHIIRVSYYRGFMYLAAEKARIQAATEGRTTFDDVALELYRRRTAKLSHDISDYRAMVADLYGAQEEARNYGAMFRGDLIVPPKDCFADLGLKLVRRDAETFELGVDSSAMGREHVMRNLVKGSRAEQAGVREGDEVVEAWMVWGAADRLDAMMRARVKRGDEVKEIMWWPRSFEKVESYEWVEA